LKKINDICTALPDLSKECTVSQRACTGSAVFFLAGPLWGKICPLALSGMNTVQDNIAMYLSYFIH
jgi:hypothetical protein